MSINEFLYVYILHWSSTMNFSSFRGGSIEVLVEKSQTSRVRLDLKGRKRRGGGERTEVQI